ncbi:hypothetical protein [Pseudomonas farris]
MRYSTLTEKFLTSDALLKFAASLIFAYALFIALYYSGQPLLEQFGFRQTQTALTSFWFIRDGFKLAYETPVSGAPWSIPFEFPVYQYIVAITSETLNTNLDKTGRIISFIFLALCIFPTRDICRQLSLPKATLFVFIGLLFSSPIYLQWGRTFMIETTAIFFAVIGIKHFINCLSLANKFNIALFVFFITLSILQKATTGLPVLAVLAIVFFFHELKKNKNLIKIFTVRNASLALILFGLPIVLGFGWAFYTDIVKSKNEFGTSITSSALAKWNWGTFAQRFSEKLYSDVIWTRILKNNLAGVLGIAIILSALFLSKNRNIKIIISTSLLLGILPLFIFTNLHLVHTYYQSANVIFFIFALSVAVGSMFDSIRFPIWIFGIFLALITSNYIAFNQGYLKDIKGSFNLSNSRDLLVSSIIRNNTSPNEAFIAFGNDWSSSFAYYAERKSFTVPNWYKNYDNVIADPEGYLGGMPLGGIVICPEALRPIARQLFDLSYNGEKLKLSEAAGCYIGLPESNIDLNQKQIISSCEGSLDNVEKHKDIPQALSVQGWTTVSGKKNELPSKVYITLTDSKNIINYYEATTYSRPDVNVFFNQANLGPAGYGRIIDTSSLSGNYSIGVARTIKNTIELCQFRKEIQISN